MTLAPNYTFTCRLDPAKLKQGTTAADLTALYSYKGAKPTFAEGNGVLIVSLETKDLEDVNMMVSVGFMIASQDGREQEAIAEFDLALAECPFMSEAYRGKAMVLHRQGKNDEAMDNLILALKYDHGNEYALLTMGNILQQQGEDKAAEVYFLQIQVFHPNHYLAIYNIGHLRLKAKRYDEAEKYFKRAINLDPDRMEAYYGMTFIEGERGNFLNAFEWACKGLTLGKKKSWSIKMEEEIGKAYIAAANSHIAQQPVSQLYVLARSVEQEYDCVIKVAESEDIDNGAIIQQSADSGSEREFEILYNPSQPNYQIQLLDCITYVMISRLEQMNDYVGMYEATNELGEKFVEEILPQVDEQMVRQVGEDTLRKMLRPFYEGLLSDMYQLATDMVMETIIYHKHPEFRPHCLIAHLSKLEMEITNNNTNRKSRVPDLLLKAVTTISLLHAIFFKKYYGLDVLEHYQLDDGELEKAEDIYYYYYGYLLGNEPLYKVRYKFLKFLAKEIGLDKYYEIYNTNNNERD